MLSVGTFGVRPSGNGPLARKLGWTTTQQPPLNLPDPHVALADRKGGNKARRKETLFLLRFHRMLKERGEVKEAIRRPGRAILADVAAQHGFSIEEMLSLRRNRGLCLARFEACYRIAHETSISFPGIGRILQRDHTTVIHGIRRHARLNGLPLSRGLGDGGVEA